MFALCMCSLSLAFILSVDIFSHLSGCILFAIFNQICDKVVAAHVLVMKFAEVYKFVYSSYGTHDWMGQVWEYPESIDVSVS